MWRGSSSRKAFAASCAASIRVGTTSPTRMLSETSIARMIVDCVQGRVMRAVGRARATINTVIASNSSAGGTCRRHGWPSARLATCRLLTRTTPRIRLRSNQT